MAAVPKRRYSGVRERATSLARWSEAVAGPPPGAAAELTGAARARVRRPTRSRRIRADSCRAAPIPGGRGAEGRRNLTFVSGRAGDPPWSDEMVAKRLLGGNPHGPRPKPPT